MDWVDSLPEDEFKAGLRERLSRPGAKPSMDDLMEAYALDAVDCARSNFQVDLDFSPESIERLEGIIAMQHDAMPRGWRRLFSRGISQAELETFAKMWGAYLGEVIRRELGGNWVIPSEGPMAAAWCLLLRGEEFISPPSKVFKRFHDPADSVWLYYQHLTGRTRIIKVFAPDEPSE